MNTLKIENFKAFEAGKAFEMSLDNNNMLVYGENGIGKTSIFEAYKIVLLSRQDTIREDKG